MLILILFWIWGCESTPEVREVTGVSTTEPWIAQLEGQVTFSASSFQAKAYVFDVDEPLNIFDSTEVDSSGQFDFQGEITLPPAFRVLVRSAEEGFLSDTLYADSIASILEPDESFVFDEVADRIN